MRVDLRSFKCATALRAGLKAAMYESSCSYAGALELKRSALKEEPWPATEWPPYRLHQSTFEQLKQSVEKAKAALQDRSGLLGTATAFGDFYGGQLGQDATSSTLGFGRTARTEDSMLGTMEKSKTIGPDKLSGGIGKAYSTPTLSDTLRATKCSDYYARWLQFKEQFKLALLEDDRIQELAVNYIGVKPQGTAVEIVGRVYSKYCELYNQLCDCYDQMEQVQRRPYIKKIIDGLTCRIIELKKTLEEVEVFEFTYPDNALQQLLIQPYDIEILCPFFYPFEIRQAEMQYIMDEIFAGNRLGDPPKTQEELEIEEQERLEKLEEQQELEARRQFVIEEEEKEIDPRMLDPKFVHAINIQRMERSRMCITERVHKRFQDQNLYLELAGLKKPKQREDIRKAGALIIQKLCRKYMEIKRIHAREKKLKDKLGMTMSSWKPPSAKIQLEKVKEARRKYRRAYYEQWVNENLKEKARVLKLREGDVMDDITDEIRQWFVEWFRAEQVFDEFPWAEEGGSILVVRGETFTVEEYVEWRTAEEKKMKSATPKSKEQIKAEKLAAKEERKRLAQEARDRERKRIHDYKKSRMNPDNDPGINFMIGQHHKGLKFHWCDYEATWCDIDNPTAGVDAMKGHIMRLITENAYKDLKLELRPIADDIMRLELEILKNALKTDYATIGKKIPMTLKRKKPKKPKVPKPDKLSPMVMFQRLADNGIVRQYPHVTLDDYWGDRNYAAADCRAILWTPTFPPACIGDVKEQVRIRCLLTLGATCAGLQRTQLLVGPKGAGKKTLAYAIATETNSLLIDLSPLTVYDKFVGGKKTKIMLNYVNKISRIMQPTVILVDKADKLFYKRVPKEEKMFDPTRLSKDFFKEIVKPLGTNDKILVIGTATEPWLAKNKPMFKAFPSTIMIPKSDYGSISLILTQMLMKFHGVNRDFNVSSLSQALRGYDICTIRSVVEKLMTGKRLTELSYKPLHPMEILSAVLNSENVAIMDPVDSEMYKTWYLSYSPWGEKFMEYMLMLESQYTIKLKNDKKKKKAA
ncbi:unnamed protein product [Spodoptera littoralis]|uniref:ATPase AAA-type core domain-containing protein n=1 Tax=Spodoptera littoralis TaxID=7109 RepID=A0A9P0NCH3_SPOLI|nr:unnamed protein product [Spodoptera littoralis]CAH1647894.1 unnamed protein product [Spodoptera littoralis]